MGRRRHAVTTDRQDQIDLEPAAAQELLLRPLSDSSLDDEAVWALVDAAPDGIVLVDETGRISLVNRQAEELFGYDRGELLGRPHEELLPERLREAHAAHRARYIDDPRTRPMGTGLVLYARRSDGREFP